MASDKDVIFFRKLFDLRLDRSPNLGDAQIDHCINLVDREGYRPDHQREAYVLDLMRRYETLISTPGYNEPRRVANALRNMIVNLSETKNPAEHLTTGMVLDLLYMASAVQQAIDAAYKKE